MKKILVFVASGFSTRMGGFPKALAKVGDSRVIINAINNSEKYYDDIYRFCYYKTGNSSLSYDLTQETFLKLIKYIGTYKHRGKFKSYLITIAMNVCNTYFDENKVFLIK